MMRSLATALILVSGLAGQTKLFSTGFESASTLGPTSNDGVMQTSPLQSTIQTITGVDASTGFNWSTMFGASGLYGSSFNGLHLIPGDGLDGQAFSVAFQNAFDTTITHTGSQSLKLSASGFTNPNCGGLHSACGQNTWEINGDLQPSAGVSLNEQYERVWVFLPTSMQTKLLSNASDYEVFHEFKSSQAHRWITFVYRNATINSGNPYWHMQVDSLTDANSSITPFYCGSDSGNPINTSVPVEFGKWFMMEFYFKLVNGASRFYWGITNSSGVSSTVFDFTSAGNTNCAGWTPATGTGEHIAGLFEMNEYGANWPLLRYIDDLEVWSTAPCGAANLPCGPANTPPTVTTTSMPAAPVGAAYSSALAASGSAPFTWDIPAGSLAACNLSLSSAGIVSGTPTAATTCTFTARATNAAGNNSKALSVNTVNTPPTLGGSCLTGTSSLTPWTCTFSGATTTAGTYSFHVQATDGTSTVTTPFTVIVNPAAAITTINLPSGAVNTLYSATLQTSGGTGAITFALAGGALPTGLSLNGTTGVISGTPTTANNFPFSITPTDANGVPGMAQNLSITINGNCAITPTTLSFTARAPVNTQFVATGCNTSTFTLSAGSLAGSGLTLGTNGLLHGTASAGTFNFTVAYDIGTNPIVFTILPSTVPGTTVNRNVVIQGQVGIR